MLVPLYGFVEGDTMGVLVLSRDDMSVEKVIEKLRESVSVRVDTDSGSWGLFVGERRLDESESVRQSGLSALDRVDLRRENGG